LKATLVQRRRKTSRAGVVRECGVEWKDIFKRRSRSEILEEGLGAG
jgi:hypothetical protein